MPEEEHYHESEAERENCVNCRLARLEARMSEMERYMLNWFYQFGAAFCMEAGITAAEWMRLNFATPEDSQIAAQILNTLYNTAQKIIADKMKSEVSNG